MTVRAMHASGAFAIGDLTPHALGTNVNFRGTQWAKNNALSGGAAPLEKRWTQKQRGRIS